MTESATRQSSNLAKEEVQESLTTSTSVLEAPEEPVSSFPKSENLEPVLEAQETSPETGNQKNATTEATTSIAINKEIPSSTLESLPNEVQMEIIFTEEGSASEFIDFVEGSAGEIFDTTALVLDERGPRQASKSDKTFH